MASGSDFPDSTSPLDPLDPVVTCRAHDAHFDDVATLPLLRHGVELAATVDAKDVAPDLGMGGDVWHGLDGLYLWDYGILYGLYVMIW